MYQVYVIRRGESSYEVAATFPTKEAAFKHLDTMIDKESARTGYVVQAGRR